MLSLNRLSEILHQTSRYLICVLSLAAVLAGIFNVANRSIFHFTIAWTEALIRYSLVWIVLIGMPILVKENKLISVDFITKQLGAGWSILLGILAIIWILIICIILFAISVKVMAMPIVINQNIATLNISKMWVYAAIPTSSAICIIHIISILLGKCKKLQK